MFVCPIITQEPLDRFGPNFWLGNSEDLRECSSLFWPSWFKHKFKKTTSWMNPFLKRILFFVTVSAFQIKLSILLYTFSRKRTEFWAVAYRSYAHLPHWIANKREIYCRVRLWVKTLSGHAVGWALRLKEALSHVW